MTLNVAPSTLFTGDNLAVLRGINSNSVDLIYLDPPFNSNRNYSAPVGSEAAGAAFKDMWTLSDIDVYEHGELAERNPGAYAVIQSAGVSHSKGMQSYLIFMAVRLMEMKRVLKETGSIYLHCDPTADYRLRCLMDAIFGAKCFRNSIIWTYTNKPGAGGSQKFKSNHDTLLFYGKSVNGATFNKMFDGVSARQKADIKRGYMSHGKHGLGVYDDTVPGVKERVEQATKEGIPVYYANNVGSGTPMMDTWEIPIIGSTAKERTGYPTQKPLKLLERIIKASSNEGDVVLDPFCGCATAMVAAARLGRQWIGIDISTKAAELVKLRLSRQDMNAAIHHVTTHPKRTDITKLPNYRTHAHRLYGEQEGVCAGCETHFPYKVMEVDHITPKSQGGNDHPENLQLLCCHCNRSKGGKTMAEWKANR